MKQLLCAPGRLAAALLIAVLIGPTAVWCRYVADVLAGCRRGFGNERITGDVTITGCNLSKSGEHLYQLPWLVDFASAASLMIALLAAFVVLAQSTSRPLRPVLAVLPTPMLLVAAVLMRETNWGPPGMHRMASGFPGGVETLELQDPMNPVYGVEPYPGGWRIRVPDEGFYVPAPGIGWYLVLCFAVVLALALAGGVLRARFTRPPAEVTAQTTPQWSGSPR